MRDGRKVASAPIGDFTPQQLVVAIVGRPPAEVFVQPPAPSANALLTLSEMRVRDVGPIRLHVRAGEVLGLCGLRGAGQNEVGQAICGIEPMTAGEMMLNGRRLLPRNPTEAIEQGIAFVSSNREAESLGMSLLVRENLYLNPAAHGRRAFSFLRRDKEKARAWA
jgi:ribose transport system ATP-binding protein